MNKENRFVNKKRTQETFLDDPNVAFWGFTEKDLLQLGWIKSEEPLLLTNEDCPMCEGSGYYIANPNPNAAVNMSKKCRKCDGTGKKLQEMPNA